eukprot:scaffold3801_cov150-Skeletonema_menzelii.AAC.12
MRRFGWTQGGTFCTYVAVLAEYLALAFRRLRIEVGVVCSCSVRVCCSLACNWYGKEVRVE